MKYILFFFQAEDGIRDYKVTGVQTCALPIYPIGYAKALETFDGELETLLGELREDDLVFITADHGCDPTDVSTDHTREYVPLVIAGPRVRGARPLGTRRTMGDLGVTVAEYLNLSTDGLPGTSVLGDLGVTR